MANCTSSEPSPIVGPTGSRPESDCLRDSNRDSPAWQVEFTATENPFLFPRDLLDIASGRRVGDLSTTDDNFPNRVPDDSADSTDSTDSADSDNSADGDDRPRWWLVHTKPRQEKKLAEQLGALNVPYYLPVTKCKALTRGRTRLTRAPQFPGYLFLRGNSEQRHTALETNRIVATHCVGDQVGLSTQLWELADLIEKGVPLRIEERLAAGRHVRVKAGLLKDKRGIIIKRGGKTRLFVFVSELLGGVSLDIEQHLLEPY